MRVAATIASKRAQDPGVPFRLLRNIKESIVSCLEKQQKEKKRGEKMFGLNFHSLK